MVQQMVCGLHVVTNRVQYRQSQMLWGCRDLFSNSLSGTLADSFSLLTNLRSVYALATNFCTDAHQSLHCLCFLNMVADFAANLVVTHYEAPSQAAWDPYRN